jgi:LysM repeat protein
MTATALKGPHIQAAGYTRGRSFVEAKEVDWLVLHTAEGAKDEVALGSYFAGTTKGSSAAGVGQDGGYASYVNYADTAWCAPPLNQEAEHLEICGFAKWTRAEWLAQKAMLETVAKWIAWRCTVRKIPIRFVSSPKVGTSGVTGHVQVNNVYRKSDHWDPGPQFPWDVVIARALAIAAPPPAVTTPPSVTVGTTYTVRAGDSYWRIANAAYRDGSKWPVISKANGNKVLQPGMQILIPKLTSTTTAPKPTRIDIPAWPGYGYVAYGKANGYVQKMQSKLRAIGYARYMPSGADGVYGVETRAAVSAFQRAKRLSVDGVMGPVTWGVLDAHVSG